MKRRKIAKSRTREMRVHAFKAHHSALSVENGSEILPVKDRTGEKETESRIETGNEAS